MMSNLIVYTNRPQFEKRFQFLSDVINYPIKGMKRDIHFQIAMKKAARADRLLQKLAEREIKWQESLIAQAEKIKSEYLMKYLDEKIAIRRLRRDIYDHYDISFKRGMIS